MAARFDLSDYVDVAERIEEFYTNHPNGHITTQLLNTAQWTGKQTQFIVQAFLYDEKGVLLSTGLAEESLGGQGANQMAALENAETSASVEQRRTLDTRLLEVASANVRPVKRCRRYNQ